ncbi:MAG: hypothetical protein GY807_16855 [Gammaproteobacteria bacterium]|nr:hypothetical protein [Gammaproteobacteria bacterium]
MSDKLVSSSIDYISKTDFELWVQRVLLVTDHYSFEPTGGIHDGGQDGFIRPLNGDPNHYVQISKQQDTRGKVRDTLNTIKKDRVINRLTYVTSQAEPERDILEAKLTKDFEVKVIIHDQRWLVIQAGLYEQLEQSLFGYARGLIDSLQSARAVKRELNFSDRLSIVTYLEAQARSLPASESFQNLCLDTLVYEALIGTDPEKGLFKTGEQMLQDLEKNHKSVLSKAPTRLSDRLIWLSSKENFPRIRKHPDDQYALPYEVRNQFDERNLALNTMEDAFIGSISRRVDAELADRADELRRYVIHAVQFAVAETFHQQAVNFVSSFTDVSPDPDIEVFSIIDRFLEEESLDGDVHEECKSAAANIFRRVCYSSNAQEREYLELLMKYFSVKFVMDGDIAVNNYFTEMAKRLRIYLGTDIIVRCLSETFVNPASRGMTNALRKLQSAGVKLHMTRQVAGEVFSHLHLTYLTFRDEYESWYRLGSLDAAKNCDKILIRAFFYAFFEPEGHTRKPRDWSDFLNQFGSASWFSDPKRNLDEFASFLVDKYEFEFVELGDLLAKISLPLAEKMARDILDQREKVDSIGNQILAHNDARMALFVNAERAENNERVTSDLYGYNTWWMTEETKVLRVLKKFGQHDDVVMQPQFLINHYLLDPRRVRDAASDPYPVTPTLFGLRITDRVQPSDMKKFLNAVGEYAQLEEPAARAKIRAAANKLKRSRYR